MKSLLISNCERYKEIDFLIENLSKEKEIIKEEITSLVGKIGVKKTEATTVYKEANFNIEVCKKKNLKILNTNEFVNYCKATGLEELFTITTKTTTLTEIDKKKYLKKLEQGCIPLEIAEKLTKTDYTFTLKIEEELIQSAA